LQGLLASVTTTKTDGSNPTKTVYRYDSTGIRVESSQWTAPVGDPTAYSLQSKTLFLTDTQNHTGYSQVLQETTYEGGVATKKVIYTIGHDQISQSTLAREAGTETWSLESEAWFGTDGHGSVRVLYDFAATIVKDAANFNRLQVYTFDAYGNLLSIGGQQLPTSNFPLQTSFLPLTTYLYSGESFDFNIGQQYLRARFYNATTGRFNRLDPFFGNSSDPQSFHKYGYVHGDPIQMIDPTGEFGVVGLLIGAAAQLLPGPRDMIRGAFEALVTAYAANLEWDVAWALDWSLADNLHTRGDDAWVTEALLRGAAQPWIDLLTGADYSDVILAAAGGLSGGSSAMAAMRPSGGPRIGVNGPSSGRRLGTSVPFKIGTTRVNAVSLGREKGFAYHAPDLGKPIRFEGAHGIPADGRLAARAKSLRERKGLTSFSAMSDRNVAVAKVEVNGKEGFIEKVNQPSGQHSEQLIATRVRDLRAQGNHVVVKEVFTERIPCTTTSCRSDLNDIMPNGSTYFFTRGKGAAAARDLTTAYRW
jgi:RHS repeat-associated protein